MAGQIALSPGNALAGGWDPTKETRVGCHTLTGLTAAAQVWELWISVNKVWVWAKSGGVAKVGCVEEALAEAYKAG